MQLEQEKEAERIQKESVQSEKHQLEGKVEQLQKEAKSVEQTHLNEIKAIQDKLNETTAQLERVARVSPQGNCPELGPWYGSSACVNSSVEIVGSQAEQHDGFGDC